MNLKMMLLNEKKHKYIHYDLFYTQFEQRKREVIYSLGLHIHVGFPSDSNGKESACNAGDPGLILRSRRFPGEGNGYPFQYSHLENSMDIGAWRAIVHGFAKSQARLRD